MTTTDDLFAEYQALTEDGGYHPILFPWTSVDAIMDHVQSRASNPMTVVVFRSGVQVVVREEYNVVAGQWKTYQEEALEQNWAKKIAERAV